MTNDTPNNTDNQYNPKEHSHVHPLVADWLTENGYTYQHEYKMPDYGRVDFYATHEDGHKLLVEAKGYGFHRVITQLAGYGVQMPDARLAIAIPKNLITKKIQNVASKYNILVIDIDIEFQTFEKNKWDDPFQRSAINQIINMGSVHNNPKRVAKKIIHWHEERNSSPFMDLYILSRIALQSWGKAFNDDVKASAHKVYSDEWVHSFFELIWDLEPEYQDGALKLFERIITDVTGLVSLSMISGGSVWGELDYLLETE